MNEERKTAMSDWLAISGTCHESVAGLAERLAEALRQMTDDLERADRIETAARQATRDLREALQYMRPSDARVVCQIAGDLEAACMMRAKLDV